MTELPRPSAASSAEWLAQSGPRLSDLCTACGACLAACPIAAHVGVAGGDATAITGDLKRLARGEPALVEASLKWVGACAKSGLCVAACPEHEKGLDAMLLVRIARQQAIVTTRQIAAKNDPTAFPKVKIFARLQLTDEELERWL
jgi:ferredoxin